MGKTSDYKFTASDFKAIFNGSYVKEASSATQDESRAAAITSETAQQLKDKLEKVAIDTSEKGSKLAFKLNKDANPYYEFGGYALDEANKKYNFSANSASKGSKISFTVKMGLDETLIDPHKITAYCFGPFNADAVDAEVAKIYANPKDYYESLKDKKLGAILFDGSKEYKGGTVESFTTTFTMGDISDSKKYVLAAYGEDEDKLELVESVAYGFEGLASGQPPRLTIASPAASDNAVINLKGSMTVKGTATSAASTIKEIRYDITVYDEGNSNEDVGTITGTATLESPKTGSDGNTAYDWSFDITKGTAKPNGAKGYTTCMAKEGDNYKYVIRVVAENSLGLEGQADTTLAVDAKEPEIKNITVTPVAKTGEDGKPVVNGRIAINFGVADSYLDETTLVLEQDGADNPLCKYTFLSNSTLINEYIYTTGYTYYDKNDGNKQYNVNIKDTKDLTFKITAKDRAGNSLTVPFVCYIDQSTDMPIVTITGVIDKDSEGGVNGASEITSGKNLFGVSSRTLSGSVSDDDGIEKATISVYTGEVKDIDSKKGDIEDKKAIDSVLSYSLPDTEGVYTVVIEATDKRETGDNKDNTPQKTIKKIYYVAVDSGAPTIKDVLPASGQYCSLDGMTVTGTVTDGSGIKSVAVVTGVVGSDNSIEWNNEGGRSEKFTKEGVTVGGNIKSFSLEDKITPPENASGTYAVKYIATDIYDQENEYQITYNIDAGAPTFKITKINGKTLGSALEGGSVAEQTPIYLNKSSGFLEVEGLVTDDVAFDGFAYYMLSDVEPVYENLSGEGAAWSRSAITTSDNKSGSWKLSIPVNSYDSGKTYSLYMTFKDNANNIAQPAGNPSGKIRVIPDGDNPKITELTPKKLSISSDNASDDVVFTVTGVSDGENGSGIEKVALYENGKEIGAFTKGNADSWTCTITKAVYSTLYETGTHIISARATDKVGNYADAPNISEVSVDSTRPTVSINSVAPTVTKDGSPYLNGVVNVSITLTDESSLSNDGCYWYVKNKTDDKVVAGIVSDGVENNVISVGDNEIRYKGDTIEINTTKITGDAGSGTYILCVYALDKGGNHSEATMELHIDQQTDLPTLSLNDVDETIAADDIVSGKNLFGTSKNLNGSANDDDGILKVTVSVYKGKTATGEPFESKDYTASTFSHPLPTAEGYYTVVVTAYDKNSDDPIPQRITSKTYHIAVDAGAPTFESVTPASGNYYSQSNPMKVTGSLKETNGIKSLTRQSKKGVEEIGTPASITVEDNGSFADEVIPPNEDGDYSVIYTATDIFGQTITYIISYKVDSAAPAFTITKIGNDEVNLSGGSATAPAKIYLNKKTGVLDVSGTVTDAVSGFDGFAYYALAETEPDDAKLSDTTVWTRSAIDATDNKDGKWQMSIPVTTDKYVSGEEYKLYITFKDGAGNISKSNANPSGIITVTPDGVAPVISGLKAEPNGLTNENKEENVVITATVKDELSGVASVALYENGVEIKNGIAKNNNGDAYTFTINTGYANLYKSGVHTLEIQATDVAGNVVSDTVAVTVDTEIPIVSINSVSPRVSKDGAEYLNGTVTVSANLSDETALGDGTEGTGNCYWYVTDNGDNKISGLDKKDTNNTITENIISISSTEKQYKNLSFSLDTTKISGAYTEENAGKGKYTLHIYAVDKAGNNVEATAVLDIDQSTDIPEVTFNKQDGEMLGIEGNTIQITAKDDDELGSVTYTLDGGDEQVLFTRESTKRTEFSKSVELPRDRIETGEHKLVVTAKDYSSVDGEKVKTYTLNFVWDNDNPTVTVDALSEFQKETITITGTASDKSGIASVVGTLEQTINGNTQTVSGASVEATLTPVEGSTTNYTWSAPVTIDSPNEAATYKWTFKATDNYGRTGVGTTTYKVDTTAPELLDDANSENEKIKFTAGRTTRYSTDLSSVWFKEGESSITISGKLKETNPDHIMMKITGKDSAGSNRDEEVNSATATQNYSINSTYYDGTNTVTLQAFDKAGNQSVTRTFSLKVDTNAPQLDSTKVTDANGNTVTGTVNTKSLKVTYTATDIVSKSSSTDVSGLKQILIGAKYGFAEEKALYNSHKDGETAAFTAGEQTVEVSDSAPIEISLNGNGSEISDGTNTLYIRLIDVAGNVYEEELATFTYDASPATVSIVSPVANAIVNKTITITGSVSDNQALPESLEGRLEVKEGANDWVSAEGATFKGAGSSWTCTFDTTKYNATGTDKEIAIRMIIPDAAGNENTTDDNGRTIVINQDSDRPQIVLTNIDIAGTTLKMSKTVYGTLTDDDSDSNGVVEGLYVIKKNEFVSGKYPTIGEDASGEGGVTTNNGWRKLNVQVGSGSFSFDGEEDGPSEFYFYCIDNGETSFYWNASNVLSQMKIAGMSDKKSDGYAYRAETQGISYVADMNAPVVSLEVARGTLSGDTVVKPADKDYSAGGMVFSKNGDYSKLYIRLKITEKVGMAKDAAGDFASPAIKLNNEVLPLDGIAVEKETHTPTENDNYDYLYTVGPIDLSEVRGDGKYAVNNAEDGQWLLNAEVKDESDQTGASNLNITMDSSAPEILITSPSASVSDAVMAAITVKGLAQDAASGIKTLAWAIPRNNLSPGQAYDIDEDNRGLFTPIGNSTAWEINFSSGSKDSPDSLLFFVNSSAYDVKSVEGAEGIYEVPIYFYVEDSVGNQAVRTLSADSTDKNPKNLMVYVDKDGGSPKAWINSPENNTTTSGSLTIYGGASDNISVEKVEIQVDVNGDGKYDEADYNDIKSNEVLGADAATSTYEVKDSKTGAFSYWYILATGTNSWKTTIDTSKITAPEIKIHCRAWDGDGNTRAWGSEITVKIDSSAPVIRDVMLVQFGATYDDKAKAADLNGKNPVSELEYTTGMYISRNSVEKNGAWFLTATITDNDGIGVIKTENVSITTSTYQVPFNEDVLNKYSVSVEPSDPTISEERKIFVPIATLKSGMVYARLTVEDKNPSPNMALKELQINIDSTAPSLFDTKGLLGSDVENELRLKPSNSQDALGDKVQVANSNGLFTFGDYVQESESGLAFLAFYFEREQSKKIFDPMNKGVFTTYAGAKANNAVYKNDDGLPALYLTGVQRPAEDSLAISGISPDNQKFIRKGGMLKIGGSYRLITKVDGNTVSFTPTCSRLFDEVEIVFAQIVDHQITESVKDGAVDSTTDDGDGMIESVNHIGSSYIWSASIDSSNIADGPIFIGVAAIDNAGNVAKGRIKTAVSNNRPRIAKVMIATDLNGDGKFTYAASEKDYVPSHDIRNLKEEDKNSLLTYIKNNLIDGSSYGEFNYYNVMSPTGETDDEAEIKSEAFKVVEGFCVLPEFVGGNGDIKYIMKQSADKTSSEYTEKSSGTTLSNMYDDGVLTSTGVGSKRYTVKPHKDNPTNLDSIISEKGGIVIESLDQSKVTAENKTYLSFTFWDATEETVQGDTSQWTHLQVPITYLTNERNVPNPTITPFYWNSKSDNSVSKDESGNLQGHIEIKTVPEVSGKIMIEGVVKDDVRLQSVVVNVNGIVSNATLNYSNGQWNYSGSSAGVLSFKGEDEEISQKGHTMKWTLECDTEQLSNKAARGVYVNVSATDWKNNQLQAANTTITSKPNGGNSENKTIVSSVEGANTAYYNMNVVPYITGVWTELSEFYRSAPSVYARTAKGNYPVRTGETVTIYGYNLAGMTAKIGETSLSIGSESTESRPAMTGTGYDVTIPTNATSGALVLKVNNIEAINNSNANDAKGSYEGTDVSHWYNRQPNNVNNNKLNDDVYFDVWEFKTAATPKNGRAEYVTMKINPKTGMPGFSYANSILYFNMPAYNSNQGASNWGPTPGIVGRQYSQIPVGMNYGGFTHSTFTFDSRGYSYGAAMCTDTQTAYQSAFFQFFSWEAPLNPSDMDQNMNYHNAPNCSRLDSSSVQIGSGNNGWQTNINRIQSPVMDTRVEGEGNDALTYVYIAYYDDAAKQVRLRWGTVGTDSYKIDGNRSSSEASNPSERPANAYGLDDVSDSARTGWSEHGKSDGGNRPYQVTDSYVQYSYSKNFGIPIQIVAASGVSGALSYYSSSTEHKAGKYVALSMVGKVAVVSWYDEKARSLVMAYNTDPTTGTTWKYKVIDTDAGLNVKTVVDGNGGIHFAYYKSTGSDLKYAYLSSYDAETPKIVTVDSFGAVGAKCTIDVAKVDNNYVPYIGYQNNGYLGTQAAAKVAYRSDFTSNTCEGSDDSDYLTGKWEISVVPTKNIPNDDLINVGVNKNDSGALVASATGTYENVSFNNGTSAVGDATIIWGNGTLNPVFGYGIDDGTIEMAQKK